MSGQIAAVSFSPNGRTLCMAVGQAPNDARLAMLDLASGRLRDTGATHGNASCVSFGGFARQDPPVLGRSRASVDSDGVSLQGIDTAHNNRIVTYGTKTSPVFTLPGSPSLATCGDSLLALVGLGRIQTAVQNKRLIVFVGNPPTHLTQKTVAYLSPSCSGEGFTVAAVQYPHAGKPLSGPATLTPVVVKDGNTSQPAPNRRFLDSSPEWDLGGDLLYARTPAGGSTAQL